MKGICLQVPLDMAKGMLCGAFAPAIYKLRFLLLIQGLKPLLGLLVFKAGNLSALFCRGALPKI